MNHKEWVEYFEEINDRKPTAAEYAAALQKGEFVTESNQTEQVSPNLQAPNGQASVSLPPEPQPSSFFAKYKALILTGLAICLSIGAYFSYQYYQESQNSLEGLWILENSRLKMEDGEWKKIVRKDYEPDAYVEVKGNKTRGFMYDENNPSLSSKPSDFSVTYSVDAKNKRLILLTTLEEYVKAMADIDIPEEGAEEAYTKGFGSPSRKYTFEKSGDRFTWKIYDGKELIHEATYRKLSAEEAQKVYQKFEDLEKSDD